jgi:hypothetical protein
VPISPEPTDLGDGRIRLQCEIDAPDDGYHRRRIWRRSPSLATEPENPAQSLRRKPEIHPRSRSRAQYTLPGNDPKQASPILNDRLAEFEVLLDQSIAQPVPQASTRTRRAASRRHLVARTGARETAHNRALTDHKIGRSMIVYEPLNQIGWCRRVGVAVYFLPIIFVRMRHKAEQPANLALSCAPIGH